MGSACGARAAQILVNLETIREPLREPLEDAFGAPRLPDLQRIEPFGEL